MRDIYYAIKRWQGKVFGPRTHEELLVKLQEEVGELIMSTREYATGQKSKPEMMAEIADVQMILFSIAQRFNTCFDSYNEAVIAKHNINRNRRWMKIGDGTWKHLPDDMKIEDPSEAGPFWCAHCGLEKVGFFRETCNKCKETIGTDE